MRHRQIRSNAGSPSIEAPYRAVTKRRLLIRTDCHNDRRSTTVRTTFLAPLAAVSDSTAPQQTCTSTHPPQVNYFPLGDS
jgi:hypothetical protein